MNKRTFLDFEQPIAELENKIEELRYVQSESAVDISAEIEQLGKKSQQLTKDIYSNLTPWQITKIARHADRPYTLDYLDGIFTDFVELHGDRHVADDLSIIGGLARFNGSACVVLGHQKGRSTKMRAVRNFGMSKPEGYRKALRLMKTAEKFKLPVFTFVDTPGAFPGIDAEERNQSEAIGRNIFEMAQLEVPIISTIIGEGGSGGALAISVADQVLMLQYAVYSVISPEGCASILWKTAERAQDAAEALGITAHRLKALVESELPFGRLENARIPCHVVATDALNGVEVVLSSGDAAAALLASAAIPAVFPPVVVVGRALIDGGIASNTPIAAAYALGARRIVVLPTGTPCALSAPPRGVIASGLHALNLLSMRQLLADIDRFADGCELRVVPPLCPLGVSTYDFSRTPELIERAHAATRAWLEGPPPDPDPRWALLPHRHRSG